VVVLLYPPGAGRSLGSSEAWVGITKSLLAAGFHVFRFDWRGHGKSTDIEDTEQFWNLKGTNTNTGFWNAKHVRGLKDKPIKNKLSVKTDFDSKYYPVYVNDLAAVRMHLDAKNDKRTINTSSLYLIGAGDTAMLGFLWMTAEWRRGAVRGDGMRNPAGVDLAGAIWLSGTRNPAISTKLFESWKPLASKLRDRNPMLFLHGESDFKGAAEAKYFVDSYLVAKGSKSLNPLEQTFLTPIKGTDANGVALLSADDTEDTILQYMKARQKDRASVDWKERKFTNPYFVDLKPFYLVP
jgi:pimeloyl-ACP methyl ester carboxylesterase